jgi:hypothetical protein
MICSKNSNKFLYSNLNSKFKPWQMIGPSEASDSYIRLSGNKKTSGAILVEGSYFL